MTLNESSVNWGIFCVGLSVVNWYYNHAYWLAYVIKWRDCFIARNSPSKWREELKKSNSLGYCVLFWKHIANMRTKTYFVFLFFIQNINISRHDSVSCAWYGNIQVCCYGMIWIWDGMLLWRYRKMKLCLWNMKIRRAGFNAHTHTFLNG